MKSSDGELARRLSDQESRLTKLERQEKLQKAGVGVGMFGVAGIAAFFGTWFMLVAVALALDTDLKAWASAFLVGAALLVIAAVTAVLASK